MSKGLSIIAAVAQNRVIGKSNTIPWKLPDDMKYFKEITIGDDIPPGNHVIMGRKNWESIPEKFRPLPGRINWIITRNRMYDLGAPPTSSPSIVVHSLEEAMDQIRPTLSNPESKQECFVIGGGEIYQQAMPLANKLYLTEIKANIDGDVFFPEFDKDDWIEISRKTHYIDGKHQYEFDFVIYERRTKG